MLDNPEFKIGDYVAFDIDTSRGNSAYQLCRIINITESFACSANGPYIFSLLSNTGEIYFSGDSSMHPMDLLDINPIRTYLKVIA